MGVLLRKEEQGFWKVRYKPIYDILDAEPLVKGQKGITRSYADRGCDAKKLYRYCLDKNIQTFIKQRKYSEKGWARRKQMKITLKKNIIKEV